MLDLEFATQLTIHTHKYNWVFLQHKKKIDTHVMCFPSKKYSSFFKPIVRRKRTSSLSTYHGVQKQNKY